MEKCFGAILSSCADLVWIGRDRQFFRYETWGGILELGEVVVGWSGRWIFKAVWKLDG